MATFLVCSLTVIGCNAPTNELESSALDSKMVFHDAKVAALALALNTDDVKQIDSLLAEGVDANSRGKYDITLLHRAIQARSKGGFASLLLHGADPNLVDSFGFAVMHLAAQDNDRYWIEQALANRGSPNILNTGASSCKEWTPLFFCDQWARGDRNEPSWKCTLADRCRSESKS